MVAGEVALVRDDQVVDKLTAPAVLGESVLLSGILPTAEVRPFTIR